MDETKPSTQQPEYGMSTDLDPISSNMDDCLRMNMCEASDLEVWGNCCIWRLESEKRIKFMWNCTHLLVSHLIMWGDTD